MIKRIVCYGFFVLLLALIFRHYLSGDAVLMTTDAAIKGSNVSMQEAARRAVPHWHDLTLLGSPRGTGTQLASLLKAFMGSVPWNNMAYGIAIILSSFVFLRHFRWMAPGAAVVGAITAFWFGSIFAQIYSGHYFKPYVVLFFVCSLLPVAGAVSGSIAHALVWGGCVGLMFVQQPDVALFLALFAGLYLVYSLWMEQGLKPLRWLRILVPAAAMAFLFASGPLLSGYKIHVKGAAQIQTNKAEEKWTYITQWSMPPEECGAFIAPGYFGWRSHEPEGPYWGRIGRSDGWEKTGQGFQNFKLDDYYLGIIPFAFAAFALFSSGRSRHRKEIWFWSAAAVVSLALAMGKYSFLYRMFYHLPVVSNVRAPIKFLQAFQVSIGILTAYGIHALSSSGEHRKPVRLFFYGMLSVSGLLLLLMLSVKLGADKAVAAYAAAGWPVEAAGIIVGNKFSALVAAWLMSVITAAVLAVFSFRREAAQPRYLAWAGAALALIVAGDALLFTRHYMREMPRSYVQANPLTDFLKENLGEQRVAFLSQEGVYNVWITYLMPFNGIPSFNFTDMPRLAQDYEQFLAAGQRDPLNMWRSAGVKYLLGPAQAEQQLTAFGCNKVFAYSISAAGGQEFEVTPNVQGPHAVYELNGNNQRYALYAGSSRGTDEQALAALNDFTKVMLSEESALPELAGKGQAGVVEVLSYNPDTVELRTRAEAATVLRIADRYDPDWTATVDGAPVEVGRVDFICMGVAVPAGEHTVVLNYAPGKLYFYLQAAGMVILIGAIAVTLKQRKRVHDTD